MLSGVLPCTMTLGWPVPPIVPELYMPPPKVALFPDTEPAFRFTLALLKMPPPRLVAWLVDIVAPVFTLTIPCCSLKIPPPLALAVFPDTEPLSVAVPWSCQCLRHTVRCYRYGAT